MKKLFRSIILAITLATSLLLVPLVVLADSWQYYVEITVTENSSTARSNLPLLLGISGQNLIDAGYLNGNATNSQMQESTFNRTSGMATGNVSLFIPSLLASQSRTYRLYTGFSPNQTSFPIMPGYGGNITVADAPNLEMGSNFSVTHSGFINTSVNGSLWNKLNAFSLNTSSNCSIIATAYNVTAAPVTLIPDASGNYTNLTVLVGAATHWQATLTNDGNTSYVAYQWGNAGLYRDTFSVQNSSLSFNISSVAVFMVVSTNDSGGGAPDAIVRTQLITNDTLYDGSQVNIRTITSYTTYNTTYTTNPQTSLAWTWAEVNAMQIGIAMNIAEGAYPQCTQVYAVISGRENVSATTPAVTSAAHNVTANISSGNLSVYIDQVLQATANFSGQSIPNNANNITIMSGNTMPYATNITLSVNNTQQLWYQPNIIINGSVLPNRASSSNNGIINWGTNPAGLIITIGGIIGYNTVVPTTNVTSPAGVGTLKSPGGWINTGAFAGVLTPELIQSFEDAAVGLGMPAGTGGIHYRTLMLMIMFGVAAAVGLSVLLFTGSVLITIFVILGVLTFGSSTGMIDTYLVWITGILSLSTFYLVKQH